MYLDFTTLNRWINPVYYKYLWDAKRFNIFFGGASSGKSHFIGQRKVFKVTSERGHNVLILRKTGRTNKLSTFPLIKQIINAWNLTPIYDINKTDLTITNKLNGNQIIFAGLDDVEKLKSLTFATGILTDIWVEEASEITENDFLQLNIRLRGMSSVPLQITLSFNPISSMHWIKRRFFDDPGPYKKKLTIFKTTYKDNNYLDIDSKEEIENLKEVDPTYYKIYALGEWGIIGNLVFTNYVVEDFTYRPEDFDDTCNGMDFGFNHPYAIEKIGTKDGEIYIYDEYHTRHKTNPDVIDEIDNERFISRDDLITADCAEPDRIKEWNDRGYFVRGAKKGKDSVKYGIDFMRSKKIHIHPSCSGVVSEFQTFKHKEDKEGNVMDEFVNFKDDGISAARYALEDKWHDHIYQNHGKIVSIGTIGL